MWPAMSATAAQPEPFAHAFSSASGSRGPEDMGSQLDRGVGDGDTPKRSRGFAKKKRRCGEEGDQKKVIIDLTEQEEEKEEKEKKESRRLEAGELRAPGKPKLGGKTAAKKATDALFQGTGLDPSWKNRKKILKLVKKKLKKTRESSSSSASSTSTTSSGSGGENVLEDRSKLHRIAAIAPGVLAAQGICNMKEFLTQVAGTGWEEDRQSLPPLLGLYHRTYMVGRLSGGVSREFSTLCWIGDLLLQGRASEAMDALVQRLKSLELTAGGTNWATSQKLELVPPPTASIGGRSEIQVARKEAKLDQQVLPSASAFEKGSTKGKEKGKDKTKRQGQGQVKGGRPQEAGGMKESEGAEDRYEAPRGVEAGGSQGVLPKKVEACGSPEVLPRREAAEDQDENKGGFLPDVAKKKKVAEMRRGQADSAQKRGLEGRISQKRASKKIQKTWRRLQRKKDREEKKKLRSYDASERGGVERLPSAAKFLPEVAATTLGTMECTDGKSLPFSSDQGSHALGLGQDGLRKKQGCRGW